MKTKDYLYRVFFIQETKPYYFEFRALANPDTPWIARYGDAMIFSKIEEYLKKRDSWEDGMVFRNVCVFNENCNCVRAIDQLSGKPD